MKFVFQFTAEISTPEVGDYALIDKVVLGIMSNITTSKKRRINNPCLTTPLTAATTNMTDVETDDDNELRRRGPTTTERAIVSTCKVSHAMTFFSNLQHFKFL